MGQQGSAMHYGRSFFGYSENEILGKPMLRTLTPLTGFEGRNLATPSTTRIAMPSASMKIRNELAVVIGLAGIDRRFLRFQTSPLRRIDIDSKIKHLPPGLGYFSGGRSAKYSGCSFSTSAMNEGRNRPGTSRRDAPFSVFISTSSSAASKARSTAADRRGS
jgi:hypothetical protein